ncbi:ABC transporter substrate-binding protein [Nocardia cyriacigeorgica]|uniref:ABC transporter substrate-binding protein n=1 Tax=Nocardia cyriacigeorgica TaxID=135487 RepID=UPI0024579D98|nr:ABC transporter substrate-binding protein [Nocardia cyriacigeorgica]
MAGIVGVGAALAACGAGSEDEQSGDGWTFTDDRGNAVTLGATPSRVVAFTGSAGALADYGVREPLVGIFGDVEAGKGTPRALAGDLNVDELTVVGDDWGQFDIEKYALLEPDLLVTDTYVPDRLWYIPDDSRQKIESANPNVIAIAIADRGLPAIIGRYEELAAALGADLTAEPVVAATARFTAAAQSVRDAVARRPGIRVLAASATSATFYVSDPRTSADLKYFAELGVELIIPDAVDDGGYFQSLSWEAADRYPADLILLDSRSSAMQPDALAANSVWRSLPAVQAGQVAPWNPVFRFSHAGAAPLLEDLGVVLDRANRLE